MQGFFTKKEIESSTPDGRTLSCVSCGLYKDCQSPRMAAYGNFKKKIMNIGEAPGEMEDKNGKPWQGRTGKALQQMYKKLGVDLFEDCININAVNCRPMDEKGGNRTPTNHEIDCCRRIVLKAIDTHKPKVIVLLGYPAVYSIIGHRWKKDLTSLSKWRGWTIPDQDYKAWVCPTFHPSYVERSDSKEVSTVWEQDLRQAFEKVNTPFLLYKEPKITELTDLSPLNEITHGPVAIDYETTGIKPHAAGHRIVSTSIAINENEVFVFVMPETRRELRPLIDLLRNDSIGKMAHNMKFEEAWSVERLKQNVVNWWWDSMLAAHVLDNRQGVTGLKFQAYVQFGIIDYSSEVEPFLQAMDNTNANSINKIDALLKKPGGKSTLLKYNALDSIYEYRLAMMQMKLISENCLPF
jgi:DNA polymerase